MTKKGRQSGSFGSKAKRAAFMSEWQSLVAENRSTTSSNVGWSERQTQSTIHKERPKLRVTHLQNMLQERLHHDRMQDRAHRQQQRRRGATAGSVNATDVVVEKDRTSTKQQQRCIIYDNEHDDYRETGLVLLCVQALAPRLQEYITEMGHEAVHHCLSLLPGETLTALSVELSTKNLWHKDEVFKVVCEHAQITRLSLSCANNMSDTALCRVLTQKSGVRRHVPDSWEDCETNSFFEDDITYCRWQRLELKDLHTNSTKVLEALLKCSGSLTHLSLENSLDYESGPEFVKQLASTSACLKVLEVSLCPWFTPRLVQDVLRIFKDRKVTPPAGLLQVSTTVATTVMDIQ